MFSGAQVVELERRFARIRDGYRGSAGTPVVGDYLAIPSGQTDNWWQVIFSFVAILPGYGRQEHCDWGLGFEIRDSKTPHWTGSQNSPRTFGHFGRSGSFLWVDPTLGLGCVALADTAFGAWAVEAWPVFSDAVIAEFAGQPVRPVM